MTPLAAILAAAATYVAVGPRPMVSRIVLKRGRPTPRLSPPLAAAACVGLAALVVLGWPLGLVAAAIGAPLAARVVNRLESREDRQRREAVERDLPLALDLIVAMLEAGQPPVTALRLCGAAVRGPLGAELAQIAGRLDVGADPQAVWESVDSDRGLTPLSRAFTRAARSGASTTRVLSRAAGELRQQRKSAAQERARSVGVKTAAPLGLCFLPAFVLIGIVPTIISAFRGIAW